MYQLTERMYDRVKHMYGETIANDISNALRNPEGIQNEGATYVTVSVNAGCRDEISCLDSATFIFNKGTDIEKLLPPKMHEWVKPTSTCLSFLEEKEILCIDKIGNAIMGKVDCVDFEDESIHMENDGWYWSHDLEKIMVLK